MLFERRSRVRAARLRQQRPQQRPNAGARRRRRAKTISKEARGERGGAREARRASGAFVQFCLLFCLLLLLVSLLDFPCCAQPHSSLVRCPAIDSIDRSISSSVDPAPSFLASHTPHVVDPSPPARAHTHHHHPHPGSRPPPAFGQQQQQQSRTTMALERTTSWNSTKGASVSTVVCAREARREGAGKPAAAAARSGHSSRRPPQTAEHEEWRAHALTSLTSPGFPRPLHCTAHRRRLRAGVGREHGALPDGDGRAGESGSIE